jgi:hypothetical protein
LHIVVISQKIEFLKERSFRGCLDARHRLPRHARARHSTVFSVAGESAAAACGEMHSAVASYGGQPNIPLVKHNVPRDDDTVCGKIEAPTPLMVGRVAEERT